MLQICFGAAFLVIHLMSVTRETTFVNIFSHILRIRGEVCKLLWNTQPALLNSSVLLCSSVHIGEIAFYWSLAWYNYISRLHHAAKFNTSAELILEN